MFWDLWVFVITAPLAFVITGRRTPKSNRLHRGECSSGPNFSDSRVCGVTTGMHRDTVVTIFWCLHDVSLGGGEAFEAGLFPW